jgi:fibronectin type 3 domain-containing protein
MIDFIGVLRRKTMRCLRNVLLLLGMLFHMVLGANLWAEDYSKYVGGWSGESIAKMYSAGSMVPPASAEPRALPTKVDLSKDMPPVGSQGMQSSCVAWATAYAAKSYQEYIEHEWKYDDNTLFSPAFIYNQINGGVDKGSSIYDACQLMVKMGCATLDTMPYNVKNYKSKPNSQAVKEAGKYKAEKFYTIKPTEISTIKSYLSKGYPVIFGATVYMNFNNLNKSNPVYNSKSGKSMGGHAMTLVGYDDSKYGGAFKLINSWGTGWGDKGYAWIPYSFFPQVTGAVMVMEDIQEKSPSDNKIVDDDSDVVVDDDDDQEVVVSGKAPGMPKNFDVSKGKYSGYIEIKWKSDSSSEKNLVMKWDADHEEWKLLDTISGQSYSDKDIQKGKYYYYSVISQNKKGYSAPTTPQQGYAMSLFSRNEVNSAYAEISASQGNYDKYIMIKFGKIPDEEGYLVFRKSQKDPDWKLIITVNEVMKKQLKKFGSSKDTGEIYIDQDIEAGIIYEYMVVPDVPKGADTPSPVVKGWAKGNIYKNPPSKPADLKVTFDKTSASLQWQASQDTVGYYVYRWEDAAKDFIKVGYTEVNKYQDVTVESGKKHQYAVKSFNWAGESKDFLK